MPDAKRRSPTGLFIVDNSDDDWKVVNYLQQWTEIARSFDIATGYFEIGGLLALDGFWQKLDQIRILMGDEVALKTKRAFEAGLAKVVATLDASIESEKDGNDFLTGVPAIVEAIHRGTILARVYRKRKFHAKAYITHGRMDVIGSTALVGSSNFTNPGLTQNVELNVQTHGPQVELLQAWYEEHWDDAEDVTPEILRTIERHTRERTPFEVYARAMEAFFEGHAPTVSEWEKTESVVYPILSEYQREGYEALVTMGKRYGGAFLCDGVGLGKTYVGLMLIERLLFERKRVALFVPRPAVEDVWEVRIREYLPRALGQLSNLLIFSHTDLLRGGKYPGYLQEVKEKIDVIIVDEAHHFRNRSSLRYQKFFEICEGKQIYFLTATPVNNSFYDLLHMMELFTRRDPAYFGRGTLGIHSLPGHFRRMENALAELLGGGDQVELDHQAAEAILAEDTLFRELMIQRSRAYVKRSVRQNQDLQVAFPERKDPKVVPYSLMRTYGGLLAKLNDAFFHGDEGRPLLSLPIYFPLNYYRGDAEVDAMEAGRQRQVVCLIRTLLLKRFESSAVAFRATCEDLLLKVFYFVRLHNPKTAQRWQDLHSSLMALIKTHQRGRSGSGSEDEEEDEDIIPEEAKKRIERLSLRDFAVDAMVMECLLDLDTLASFLDELRGFDPARDHKLQQLIAEMQSDEILSKHKVLIFTEYRNTAAYLREQLEAAGIGPLDEVDSLTRRSRSDIIRSFSPYYNGGSSAGLEADGHDEIRVLISTDVLSEGLNLQDATCIINYDLHWNPVRLMQRIGRVDRRLTPEIEARMVGDHPELAEIRGTVWLWNFLPPDELNEILSLYERVTNKTLRISKIFGIEGKKLLTPEDDFEALRTFNQTFEGTPSQLEQMRLAYHSLRREHPQLMAGISAMPLRLFSGKALDDTAVSSARALFFCYRLPAQDVTTDEWSDEAGQTRWYLYDRVSEEIGESATAIFEALRCEPETERRVVSERTDLIAVREQMDKHIKNTYLKRVQAPVGVKPALIAWMELL